MQREIDEREGWITQLAALLCQAARLARWVNSDEFSEEQRDRLRDLVGRPDYLELTMNLCQMLSADAREQARTAGCLQGQVINGRR
jgi:hypothetical protein